MPKAGADKRRKKRLSVRDIAVVYTEDNLFSFFKRDSAARHPIVDISPEGLQFLCAERLQDGEKVKLTILLPEGHKPVAVRGRVKWAQQIPRKSLFRTGVELVNLEISARRALENFAAEVGEKSIRVLCHHCGSSLRVKKKFEGQKSRCPRCGSALEIVDVTPTGEPGAASRKPSDEKSQTAATKASDAVAEVLGASLRQFLRYNIHSRVQLALIEHLAKGAVRADVFSPKELAKLMGQSERMLVAVCKDLASKGMLREVGTRTYNFAPGKRARAQIAELQRASVNPKLRSAILAFVLRGEK